MFTSFLILDAVAFMLSVASVIVITAFPLILKRTPHQAAWWGGTLLLLSMIAFIGAFVLAGFVTVAYKAPGAGCASLLCEEGGSHCGTAVFRDGGAGGFVLDPNVAALNNLVPARGDLGIVCLWYNESVATSADTVTLYPATPSCPGFPDYEYDWQWDSCDDVKKLLEDDSVQQQVVCASPGSFLSFLSTVTPVPDLENYTIPISMSLLSPYSSLTEFYQADATNYITDLIGLGSEITNNNTFKSYAALTYQCRSNENDESSFNTLCDSYRGFSVSKRGEYIAQATASTAGAVIFHTDKISRQLAVTVEALSGFFGLVLLIIIAYLIKGKLK